MHPALNNLATKRYVFVVGEPPLHFSEYSQCLRGLCLALFSRVALTQVCQGLAKAKVMIRVVMDRVGAQCHCTSPGGTGCVEVLIGPGEFGKLLLAQQGIG